MDVKRYMLWPEQKSSQVFILCAKVNKKISEGYSLNLWYRLLWSKSWCTKVHIQFETVVLAKYWGFSISSAKSPPCIWWKSLMLNDISSGLTKKVFRFQFCVLRLTKRSAEVTISSYNSTYYGLFHDVLRFTSSLIMLS